MMSNDGRCDGLTGQCRHMNMNIVWSLDSNQVVGPGARCPPGQAGLELLVGLELVGAAHDLHVSDWMHATQLITTHWIAHPPMDKNRNDYRGAADELLPMNTCPLAAIRCACGLRRRFANEAEKQTADAASQWLVAELLAQVNSQPASHPRFVRSTLSIESSCLPNYSLWRDHSVALYL